MSDRPITTRQRRSVAGAFATTPPNRSEGLAGLLPRRSTPTEPPATPDEPTQPAGAATVTAAERPTAQPVVDPTPTVTVSPTSVESPTPAGHVGEADGGTMVTITAYLDQQTRSALRAYCAQHHNCDQREAVIGAFDAVGPRLATLFRQTVSTSASGIPIRHNPVQVKGGIQTWFRFTVDQRAWLEQQKNAVGARSRSHLLATVLAEFLGTTRDA